MTPVVHPFIFPVVTRGHANLLDSNLRYHGHSVIYAIPQALALDATLHHQGYNENNENNAVRMKINAIDYWPHLNAFDVTVTSSDVPPRHIGFCIHDDGDVSIIDLPPSFKSECDTCMLGLW